MSHAAVFRGTVEVCRELGIPTWRVEQFLRDGRIAPPQTIVGHRAWSETDVARLREALAAHFARTAARGPRTAAPPAIQA